MDQVSPYAADQAQQPKHDKQRDNRPQHSSLLLIISSSSQVISTFGARRSSHLDKPQGLCRTVCGLYSNQRVWRRLVVIRQIDGVRRLPSSDSFSIFSEVGWKLLVRAGLGK